MAYIYMAVFKNPLCKDLAIYLDYCGRHSYTSLYNTCYFFDFEWTCPKKVSGVEDPRKTHGRPTGCIVVDYPQIFHAYSTNIPCLLHEYSMQIPRTFHVYCTHIPYTFHEYSIHIPRIFHACSTPRSQLHP